jgi:hypothetical protein
MTIANGNCGVTLGPLAEQDAHLGSIASATNAVAGVITVITPRAALAASTEREDVAPCDDDEVVAQSILPDASAGKVVTPLSLTHLSRAIGGSAHPFAHLSVALCVPGWNRRTCTST